MTALAPAFDATIVQHDARVQRARRDCDSGAAGAEVDGNVRALPRLRVAKAELALAIGPPAFDVARVQHHARVSTATRDFHSLDTETEVDESGVGHGHAAAISHVDIVAVPQCSISAPAPAFDVARVQDGARVAPPGGDGNGVATRAVVFLAQEHRLETGHLASGVARVVVAVISELAEATMPPALDRAALEERACVGD